MRFTCDPGAVWFQPIQLNGLKSLWTTAKVVHSNSNRITWYFCTMRSGAGKHTAIATCVLGVVSIELTPAADRKCSEFWMRRGKRAQNVGFPHLVLVWTASLLSTHFLFILESWQAVKILVQYNVKGLFTLAVRGGGTIKIVGWATVLPTPPLKLQEQLDQVAHMPWHFQWAVPLPNATHSSKWAQTTTSLQTRVIVLAFKG